MEEKEKFLGVFDNNPEKYDQYRPTYPNGAIKDIVEWGDHQRGDDVLEIGCGTGQLTKALLLQGLKVTAIEKGKRLADFTRKKFKYADDLVLENTPFEEFSCDRQFHLITGAQSFHWIDYLIGLHKIDTLLRPGGSVALIWNVDTSHDTDFWKSSQPVYQKYMPVKPWQYQMIDRINECENEMKSGGLLTRLDKREYRWSKKYTKNEYLGLLSTFSSHMVMSEPRRSLFFGDLESLIDDLDGSVIRNYTTILLLGKI